VKLQTSPKPNVAKKPKIVKPKKPVQPSIESRAIASEINNMVLVFLEQFANN
jgi:hypothetical protein